MKQSITIFFFIAYYLLLITYCLAQSANIQSSVGSRQSAVGKAQHPTHNTQHPSRLRRDQHSTIKTQNPEPTFSLIKSIPVNASFFTTGNLGQFYIIDNNQLSKFNQNGDLLYTYSEKILGNISFVDAANPLRLLLFYRDFVQIIFLDKTLSAIGGNILLENLGFEQAILTCTSNDNGFWLYDTQDFQLLRLDQNLKTTHNSGPINQILGIELMPNFLIEYNNFVYLNDTERGILVFDIYGTYYKTIPLKGLTSFQVIDDNIFYFSENTLNSHHLKTLEASTINLPDTGIASVRIEKQKLFLLKENSLDIYSINY